MRNLDVDESPGRRERCYSVPASGQVSILLLTMSRLRC